MQVKTNAAHLIEMGVMGAIQTPASNGYIITEGGKAMILPQIGGITYNVKVGDSTFGWAGEAIEPGVALFCEDRAACDALCSLSCVLNEVTVASGDAKGAKGYVIGKHRQPELASNHVIVHFEQEVLEQLNIGDRMLIRAKGTGLQIPGTDLCFHSCSPALFYALDPHFDEEGNLSVNAAKQIPGELMGFILGSTTFVGDFDMMTDDGAMLDEYGLRELRIGDIVFISDCDCSYMKNRNPGSATVGVVTTSDNPTVGRGVGVLPLFSSAAGKIKPNFTDKANLSAMVEGLK